MTKVLFLLGLSLFYRFDYATFQYSIIDIRKAMKMDSLSDAIYNYIIYSVRKAIWIV